MATPTEHGLPVLQPSPQPPVSPPPPVVTPTYVAVAWGTSEGGGARRGRPGQGRALFTPVVARHPQRTEKLRSALLHVVDRLLLGGGEKYSAAVVVVVVVETPMVMDASFGSLPSALSH